MRVAVFVLGEIGALSRFFRPSEEELMNGLLKALETDSATLRAGPQRRTRTRSSRRFLRSSDAPSEPERIFGCHP